MLNISTEYLQNAKYLRFMVDIWPQLPEIQMFVALHDTSLLLMIVPGNLEAQEAHVSDALIVVAV